MLLNSCVLSRRSNCWTRWSFIHVCWCTYWSVNAALRATLIHDLAACWLLLVNLSILHLFLIILRNLLPAIIYSIAIAQSVERARTLHLLHVLRGGTHVLDASRIRGWRLGTVRNFNGPVSEWCQYLFRISWSNWSGLTVWIALRWLGPSIMIVLGRSYTSIVLYHR